MTRLVLGGYGPELGVVELGPDGFGTPVAVADAPSASFVVTSADGRFVYAVLEASGQVAAWAVVDDGPWRPLGLRSTGGVDPCHLALTADGRWCVVANYTSGSVAVHPVGADGALGEHTDLVQHVGPTGPVADRQEGPHAHEVVVTDGGLLVCDLGLDAVVGYHLEDGRLTEVARSPFPPGTGPRHLVVDGGVAYVIGELASTMTVCDVDGLALSVRSSVSLRAPMARGESTAAEVVLAGDQVLGTNRGDDTVTVLARTPRGLRVEGIVPSGGSWPRWAGLVDGDLLVGHERSHRLVRLVPDGAVWRVHDGVDWPSPTCAAALP